MNNILTNNNIEVIGKITEELKIHHTTHGENFLKTSIEVIRLSGSIDTLTVIISERILLEAGLCVGDMINLKGQIRTYNNIDNSNKLEVYIFAEEYSILEDLNNVGINEVKLRGFICKTPRYRELESGRQVSDTIIAVNRKFRKSDYIPVIFWGRNAAYVKTLPVGSEIEIDGRFQSREYIKKLESGDISIVTYEVSTNKVKLHTK